MEINNQSCGFVAHKKSDARWRSYRALIAQAKSLKLLTPVLLSAHSMSAANCKTDSNTHASENFPLIKSRWNMANNTFRYKINEARILCIRAAVTFWAKIGINESYSDFGELITGCKKLMTE